MTATAFLVGVALGLLGYAWITAPERRRTRDRLNRTTARLHAVRAERTQAQALRDRYQRLYMGQVKANALMLPHVDVKAFVAAAWRATNSETPIADELAIQRFADGLDETLAEILGSEGE